MMDKLTVGQAKSVFASFDGFEEWSSWFDDNYDSAFEDALRSACRDGLRWGANALHLTTAWQAYEAVERSAWQAYEAVQRRAREAYEAVQRPARESLIYEITKRVQVLAA
jgi:hypothetical protein